MRKKSVALLKILVAFLIILSVGIAGCSSKAPSVTTATQSAATPTSVTTTITPISDPAEIELSLGQTASNPERQVTVYSAYKTSTYIWKDATSTPTYVEKAEDGSAFIVVDGEVKNIGSEYFTALPNDFIVSDPEGTRYGCKSSFIKSLYKNQSARGIILFTVPENAKNLNLYYNFGNVSGGPRLASWPIN